MIFIARANPGKKEIEGRKGQKMMMFSLLPSCYDEIIRSFKEEFEMKKNAGALLLVLALLLGMSSAMAEATFKNTDRYPLEGEHGCAG